MSGIRRAELVLAGLGLIVGVSGLVVARNVGFTSADGAILFERGDDVIWAKLLQFSPLGAIVTVALASVALLGAWIRQRALVLAAAAGYAICSLQVIVQFGRSDNVLGVRGGNLALFLALTVGLAALALTDVREPVDAGPGSS